MINLDDLVYKIKADMREFDQSMKAVDLRMQNAELRAQTMEKRIGALVKKGDTEAARLAQRQLDNFIERSLHNAERVTERAMRSLRQTYTQTNAQLDRIARKQAEAIQRELREKVRMEERYARTVENSNRALERSARTVQRINNIYDKLQINIQKQQASEQRRIDRMGRDNDTGAFGIPKGLFRAEAVHIASSAATDAGMAGIRFFQNTIEKGADLSMTLAQITNNTSLTTKEMLKMEQASRSLSKALAVNVEETAESIRLVENYGFSVAESVNIATPAMKAAVATGSDLSDTTETLSKSMVQFKIPAQEAERAMQIMMMTAARSSLEMESLVKVAGELYAIAAPLGVTFIEANAALVTFTKAGLSAHQAATQFRNDIQKIIAPTKQVKDRLAEVSKLTGVNLVRDFSLAGLKAKGLTGVFDDIRKAADKLGVTGPELASKLFPNLRGTVGALIMSGSSFNTMQQEMGLLAKTAKEGTDILDQRFNRVTQETGFKLKQLKMEFADVALVLARDMGPAIKSLAETISNMFKWWNSLSSATRANITMFGAIGSVALVAAGAIGTLTAAYIGLRAAMAVTATQAVATNTAVASGAAAGGVGMLGRVGAAAGVGGLFALPFLGMMKGHAAAKAEETEALQRAAKGSGLSSIMTQITNQEAGLKRLKALRQQGIGMGIKKDALLDGKIKSESEKLQKLYNQAHRMNDYLNPEQAKARAAQKQLDAATKGMGIFGENFKPSMPGADPLGFLEDAGKKAKKARKVADPVGDYLRRLQRQATRQEIGGVVGQVWGEIDEGVLQPGRGSTSAQRKKALSIASGIDEAKAYNELVKQFRASMLQLDESLFKVGKSGEYVNILWETTYGSLKKLDDEQKEALRQKAMDFDQITRNNKVMEDYHRILEEVNEPLKEQQTTFERIFMEIASNEDLFNTLGAEMAVQLAMQAQLNEFDAEAAEIAERQTQAIHDVIDSYKVKQAVAEDATEVAKLEARIANGEFNSVSQALIEQAKAAALAADQLKFKAKVDEDLGSIQRDLEKQLADVNAELTELTDVGGSMFDRFLAKVKKQFPEAIASLTPEKLDELTGKWRRLFDEAGKVAKQVDLTKKYQEVVRNLKVEINELARGLVEQNNQLDLTNEEFAELNAEQQKTIRTLQSQRRMFQFVADAANGVRDVFMDVFNSIYEDGFRNLFDKVLIGFEQMLFRMAAEYAASALANLFFQGVGALVGAIGGGGRGSGPTGLAGVFQEGDMFGGFRANGGPVRPGRAYLVGERGPELLIPNAPGTVVNNAQVADMGAGTVVVNMTVYANDANSFARTKHQMMTQLQRELEAAHRRR